jgi:Ca2+-binding EF-hand superfamily protein
VDIHKLKDIRASLKKRYLDRNDLRKIFTHWDRGGNGHIRPSDVQAVLADFGLPVNSKEATALVATANTSRTGHLNLAEFIEFVFPATDVLDRVQRSNLGSSDSAAGRLVNDLQDKAVRVKKDAEQFQLKTHIKKHLPALSSELLAAGDDVKFSDFYKVLMQLGLPLTFCNEDSLKHLYTEAGGASEGLNTREFIKSVRLFDVPIVTRNVSPLMTEQASFDSFDSKADLVGKRVLDIQRLPVNKLESINQKAKTIRYALKRAFTEAGQFQKALSAYSTDGSIGLLDLEAVLRSNLGSKVPERELESFLTAHVYNKQAKTSIQNVVDFVYR